ncbi:MAG: hypothetical protein Fur0010_09980 [Bdellovibrio sp.]
MARSLLFFIFICFNAMASECPMSHTHLRGTLERLYVNAPQVNDISELPSRAELRSFWQSYPETSFQDGNCGTDGFYKLALTGHDPDGVFLAFDEKNVFIPLRSGQGLRYPTNPYGHGIFCKLVKDENENIIICSFYAGPDKVAYSCFSDSPSPTTKCIFEDIYQ